MEYVLKSGYYLIRPEEKKDEIQGIILPKDEDSDELCIGIIETYSGDDDEPYFDEGKRAVYSKRHKDSPVESVTLDKITYDVVPAAAMRLVESDNE